MKKFVISLFCIALLAISWTQVKHGFGSIGGYTGAPSDGKNCGNCHPNNVRPAANWVQVTNLPADGFTPGDTLDITLQANQNGMKNAGFEMRAEDALKNQIGSFVLIDAVKTRTTNFNSVTHTDDGHETNTGSISWNVRLAVPQNAPDTFKLYTCFNLNNGGYGNKDSSRTNVVTLYKSPIGNYANNQKAAAHVFPNPTYQTLNFEGIGKAERIEVYDMNGKLVLSTSFKKVISLDGLNEGMYFVKVRNHTQDLLVKRIVKLD